MFEPFEPSNNQTKKDGRPTFTRVSQQVTRIAPPLGHVPNIYDVISSFETP